MSLFGKLFSKRTPEEERAQADALFAAEDFGAAKLAYERAQDLVRAQPDQVKTLAEKIDACRDAIAKRRIAEAVTLIEQGNFEYAREELQGAIETAASPELIEQAERQMERTERTQRRVEQAAVPEQEAADRYEVIAGGFDEDQYAEYDAHGEPMKRAILAFHDGKPAEARAELEALVASADAPRYLWFEVGRARIADGDAAGGADALAKFLATLHEEEGGDARLLAHMELAQQVHARGDFDGALAHYEQALEAMPDDPRPYLAMATFLRREKQFDEAIEVLEAALASRDAHEPDFRLWHELGLTYADAGRDEDAIKELERTIDFLTRRNQRDLPPEGTIRLALLYEKSDRPARALDLYALLADGSDRTNAYAYRLESARLMQKLGLGSEARRAMQRARDEAPADEAVRAEVEKICKSLEAGVQPSS